MRCSWKFIKTRTTLGRAGADIVLDDPEALPWGDEPIHHDGRIGCRCHPFEIGNA